MNFFFTLACGEKYDEISFNDNLLKKFGDSNFFCSFHFVDDFGNESVINVMIFLDMMSWRKV
jgi:hypothetical protein